MNNRNRIVALKLKLVIGITTSTARVGSCFNWQFVLLGKNVGNDKSVPPLTDCFHNKLVLDRKTFHDADEELRRQTINIISFCLSYVEGNVGCGLKADHWKSAQPSNHSPSFSFSCWPHFQDCCLLFLCYWSLLPLTLLLIQEAAVILQEDFVFGIVNQDCKAAKKYEPLILKPE